MTQRKCSHVIAAPLSVLCVFISTQQFFVEFLTFPFRWVIIAKTMARRKIKTALITVCINKNKTTIAIAKAKAFTRDVVKLYVDIFCIGLQCCVN